MESGGLLVWGCVLCSRVFGWVFQVGLCLNVLLWPCMGLFSLDIPGLCGSDREVQGVGFAYILVSAVTYVAQAHGEILACREPHDQKACGFVRDLWGGVWTGGFRLVTSDYWRSSIQ